MSDFYFLPEEAPKPATRNRKTLHRQKPPLKPREVWAIRTRLEILGKRRVLLMTSLTGVEIDSPVTVHFYRWSINFRFTRRHVNDVYWPNFPVPRRTRLAGRSLWRTAGYWPNPVLQKTLICEFSNRRFTTHFGHSDGFIYRRPSLQRSPLSSIINWTSPLIQTLRCRRRSTTVSLI
jgi:hypothetical protein